AELRRLAGFPLYRDMKLLLDIGRALRKDSAQIAESAMETAKVLASLWKFRYRARAFRGFSGSLAEAEHWLKKIEVGACVSEPTVLLSSESLEVALRYGSTLLFRLKSLSGIPIGLASKYPEDREIAFPAGACFEVVEVKKRAPAKELPQMW